MLCHCGLPIYGKVFPYFCPCGLKWDGSTSTHVLPTKPTLVRPKLHQLWDDLHYYPIHHWTTPEEAEKHFHNWQSLVTRYQGSCGCAKKWEEIVRSNPPVYDDADSHFIWTWERHNDVNQRLGKRIVSLEEARRRYRSARNTFITWDDLTRDTATLAKMITVKHPNLTGVAGCPRSGMRAATDIALRLGVPLYSASRDGLLGLSSGVRLRNTEVHGEMNPVPENGDIVLVEDSTCSGFSIIELKAHPDLKNLPVYAVYGAAPGREALAGCAVVLDLPHWFEWNLWNNGQILKDMNVGIDWDGILNEDCLVQNDDDGVRYMHWIRTVEPIRTPRRYKIPYIITGRREKFRPQCEDWLRKHQINYGELIMYPRSFQERMRDVAQWKAEQVNRLGCQMYIESEPWQANIIRSLTNATVLQCSGIQD